MRMRKEEKILGDFCNGKCNNIQIIHDSRHMLRYLDLDQSRRSKKRLSHTQTFGQTNSMLREDKADREKNGQIFILCRFTGKYA